MATAPDGVVVGIEHLYKQYETAAGPVPVLKDVNLEIRRGEFVAIMGPSGSGKSTFMNILGCLDTPTRGRYVLDGHDTSALGSDDLAGLRNRFIGFVFQGFNLLPVLTARENVELPLLLAPIGKRHRREQAERALALVGLTDRMDHKPRELSGGQEQRVAIARAIASDPEVILADEPTGDLDRATADAVLDLLQRLNRELKKTILMVTHDPAAAGFADQVIHLDKGKLGRIDDNRKAVPAGGR